jgi:SNF2 family DNA or RNA helicase
MDAKEPIFFKWPSLLKTEFYQNGQLCPLVLRNYQRQQILHMTRLPRFINGDGVGLGKTVDTIASACWVKERHPNAKFLVLTTKSTTWQWGSEFSKFSDLRPFVMVDEYKGQSSYKARLQQLRDFLAGAKKDVMVCKYTSVIGKRKKGVGQFDVDGNPTNNGTEVISEEIKEFCRICMANREDLWIILDECQKFKGVGNAIRQLIANLCNRTDHVWALTATVVKNDLAEFYSISSALNIRPFGYLDDFNEKFCIFEKQHRGNGIFEDVLRGYHNLKDFREGMRPFFLGRSQAQVKEPLPKLSTSYIPIDLSAEQVKLLLHDIPEGTYQLPPSVTKVAGEIIIKDRNPDNLMTMMSVYQLVANHPALLDPSDKEKFLTPKLSPKEEELLYLLDGGDLVGEKVIVYTKYRTWIDRLDALTNAGQFTRRKFLRITGAESEKTRDINKRLFQSTADHDLIVINNAGMEGINLQSAAHMILLDCPWSWGDLIQLVGRMVRMASPHSACTLHIMAAKGTMDEYTIEVLKGKKGIFETILGESHSAGILDNNLEINLDSGMDQAGTDEEFRRMLTAHVKSVSMKSFTDGKLLFRASTDSDYKMIFEDGGKKPRRGGGKFAQMQDKYQGKWDFPEAE